MQYRSHCVLLSLLICLAFNVLAQDSRLHISYVGVASSELKLLQSMLTIEDYQGKNIAKSDIDRLNSLTLNEIKTYLNSKGYYHAQITSEWIREDQSITVTFGVVYGKPVRIQKISIHVEGEGQTNPVIEKSIKEFPLKKGDVFDHTIYEKFKESLLSQTLQNGYLSGSYTHNEVFISLVKNEANILLALNTGKQYVFGHIDYVSNVYKDSFLNQYLPFHIGSPYTTEQLVQFQRNLMNTDLFSKIRIDPQPNLQKRCVPVKVRLIAKPKNKYTASIGYGTDTGQRGSLQWERRRFTHPGHKIYTNLKMSARSKELGAQYTLPGKIPITDKIALGTAIEEVKTADKKYSLKREISVSHFQKRHTLERILAIQYFYETDRILRTGPKDYTHYLLPTVGFTRITIKERELLQHGYLIGLSVQAGSSKIFSSSNMIKTELKAKWIVPIGNMMRLILRGNLGSIKSSNFSKVPLSLRFFAGGDNTVRGYGYQTLGPRETDANGNTTVVGGRYLVIGSIELERKIYKNIALAVFNDNGNAMDKFKSHLCSSVGIGLRYRTLLGPFRVDLAQPLIHGKHKPRLHLTFGMDL